MKIKKVEICGFKSFVDKTLVHIDHDVTAIVGPNGCGKSNIVDAMRWAMGEQSAKNLRGKSMDDVIFNGSETRGPHSFAEVTLTFDNSDGLAPPAYKDYAEIAITRRLDRTGQSDYYINKTPVRLLDITELFLGTGVGTKAYSIIEQGRIGYIVSSKPEDRRHLIEEAAGITKFKAKKKAAERKMDQTRQNLLRIGDIVSEIDKNLASLKRQAQKAERYRAYRSEIRDLELHVASHRWMELTVTSRVVHSELDRASAIVDGNRAALRVREAELSADRLRVSEGEIDVDRRQREVFALDTKVKEFESKIGHQKERLLGLVESEKLAEREIEALATRRSVLGGERDALVQSLSGLEDAERLVQDELERELYQLEERKVAAQETEGVVAQARQRASDAAQRIARAEVVLKGFERRRDEARTRLDKLRSEREDLSARVTDLSQNQSELRQGLEGFRAGKEMTGARKEQLETELKELREAIVGSEREVERSRTMLSEKRSRLRSLEEIQARFEGLGAGVRAIMTQLGSAEQKARFGILGLVADHLECESDSNQALAAALGDALSTVVVDTKAHAQDVLRFLDEGAVGRASVISLEAARGAAESLAPLRAAIDSLCSSQESLTALRTLVRVAPGSDAALCDALLSHVVIASEGSPQDALRLPPGALSVSRRGDVWTSTGILTGGKKDEASAHMLEVKREIRELSQVVGALDSEMTQAVEKHGELRGSIASRQGELDAARTEAHDAEIAIVKAEKDLRAAEESLLRTRERLEKVIFEADDLSQALNDAQGEERDATLEIEEASAAKRDAESALATMQEVYEERRALVEQQGLRVADVRVRAAQAKQRAEGDRMALDRLERSVEELGDRETRLRGDVMRAAKQQGEIAGLIVLEREELADTITTALRSHDALLAARTDYDASKATLMQKEEGLREIRERIDANGTRAQSLALEARELEIALAHLIEQIQERHRVDVRSVLTDYHDREIPTADTKARIDELLRLVERMGEINLTAIEEYEEQSKRHEYLHTQKTDLEDALIQLDKAIKQMNKESRRMFRETFDAVNERFKQVFPKLFGGGKAELQLTNPDDLLESGVEILAQPPGKRIGAIELMSGGEKALTAVSLIFSIFQYRPSPFCLLDEVDAPLDEANIGRFSEAIRAMTKHSQFIVITHSKKTMQTADVLYGVTMDTPGISKIVSVELRKIERAKQAPEATAVA